MVFYADSRSNLVALRKLTVRAFEGCSENRFSERLATVLLLVALQRTLESGVRLTQLSEKDLQVSVINLKSCVDAWLPANLSGELAADLDSLLLVSLAKFIEASRDLLFQFDERVCGYIYQLATAQARSAAQSAIQQADKSTRKEELIAFTKLYTPAWVVDFLLANTILPHLATNSPAIFCADSELCANDVSGLAELSVLDPCCGAGHFLGRAFDYLNTLAASAGLSETESCHLALRQISGADIDRRALWICGLVLALKAHQSGVTEPAFKLNLVDAAAGAEDQLGSLRKDSGAAQILRRKYSVVVTNPPYIGRRLIDRRLKQALRENYPSASGDLSSAFLSRALEMLKPNGRVGFITQSSILYLPTYAAMREQILDEYHLESVVETGPRVFPLVSGEKVDSVLLVVSRSRKSESHFLDLRNAADKHAALVDSLRPGAGAVISLETQSFQRYRNKSFNFRCPPFLSEIIAGERKLSDLCEIRQGLATTDNARFLRNWWQIDGQEIGRRWQPYVKGSGSERWFSPIETVVEWADDGAAIKAAVAGKYSYLKGKTAWVVKNEQFYFRPGLTFSFVNGGAFSCRLMPSGCIFDVGGSAIFPPEEERFVYLAYLNSSFAILCAELLNPTINLQVGDLKDLPLPHFDAQASASLDRLARICVDATWTCRHLSGLDVFTSSSWRSANPRGCETRQDFSATAVDRVLSGEDPAAVWSQLSQSLQQAHQMLLSAENEIDDLVLSVVAREYDLTEISYEHLRRMCADRAGERQLLEVFPSATTQFAQAVVCALTHCVTPAAVATAPQLVEALDSCGSFRQLLDKGSPLSDWLQQNLLGRSATGSAAVLRT